MPIDPIFHRRPDFLYEAFGDEALVHYPGAARAISMSRSAELIWVLCDGGATPSAIKANVAERLSHPIDVTAISHDVDAALFLLVEAGALTVDPAGAHRLAGLPAPLASTATVRYSRRPNFIHELIDDEVLLYYPGALRAVRMSPTAAMIWSLCDDASAVEIATLLAETYPDSAADIARDVDATLAELQAGGALIQAGT